MNILVLAGGTSTERDVSLSTGAQVCSALKKRGHRCYLVDVFLGVETDAPLSSLFSSEQQTDPAAHAVGKDSPDLDTIRNTRREHHDGFFGANVLNLCRMADIVFMALHGENGENGKIQAAFDLLGIRYTGSGCFASAISMNKQTTKDILTAQQIPVPKGLCVRRTSVDTLAAQLSEQLHFPLIVKPCCGGSSVGMSKASTLQELKEALAVGFSYEEELVAEECITGREFSVGVLGGKALPVIEIAPKEGLYDYKNKYQAGSTVETCPADLPEQLTAQMQQYAEQAYRALHLEVYARIDFLMDADSHLYCLEANTLPGMTPTSLLPQEAAAAGVSFEDLCETIIQTSLEKPIEHM